MVRGLVILLVAIAAVIAGAFPALAQDGPPDVPIRAVANRDGVEPGGSVRIAVIYDVPRQHHIQQNEFFFAQPAEGETFTLGDPALPASTAFDGEPVFAGTVKVLYELRVPAGTQAGDRALKLKAGYQICSESPVFACFGPEERDVELALRVLPPGAVAQPMHADLFPGDATGGGGPGAPRVETAPAQTGDTGVTTSSEPPPGGGLQEGLAARLRAALAKGSWFAFLLVFFAGFLTSFTPCVYPMIPITIGYVAGASRGRLSGFFLSLFFVLGIAIVYSTLGIAAAFGGAVFGSALQSPIALVVIAAVFLLMGVSMLGAFDISLPSGFQTKLQSGPRSGPIGAVIMGGVTGLVASPCVGPVLVVLLAWVAQVGRPVYGFTLLFTFAAGLGLLFLVLGTFVGAMRGLPRAGAWMESVKHYFGWIFLGMAIFYLRTLLGPTITAIAAGALLILLATQIGAFTPLTPEQAKHSTWRKGIGIVLAVLGIGLMTSGLFAHQGWKLALQQGGGGTAVHEVGLAWRTDQDGALGDALAQGRPVLIDFTAEWCAACHELDKETWSHPDVMKELDRYIALRLDMTRNTPETASLDERWDVQGLPTVIILDSKGKEAHRFFGFRPAEQVLPLLRSTT